MAADGTKSHTWGKHDTPWPRCKSSSQKFWIVDTAIPGDSRTEDKEHEKITRYQRLQIKLEYCAKCQLSFEQRETPQCSWPWANYTSSATEDNVTWNNKILLKIYLRFFGSWLDFKLLNISRLAKSMMKYHKNDVIDSTILQALACLELLLQQPKERGPFPLTLGKSAAAPFSLLGSCTTQNESSAKPRCEELQVWVPFSTWVKSLNAYVLDYDQSLLAFP